MIPILFFSLCVTFAGVEDCDYEWIVFEPDELRAKYLSFDGQQEIDKVGAFYISAERTVYLSTEKTLESLLHEIKHIECSIQLKLDLKFDTYYCNFLVDLVYTVAPQRLEFDCPILFCIERDPNMTERMRQTLIFENLLIATIF